MAGLNQDRGVGADLLRQLFSGEGQSMLTKGNEMLMGLLGGPARLAGTASVAPSQDIMQPKTRELVLNEELLKAAKSKISKGAKETVNGMTLEQAADITAQGENMMNQQQGAGQTGTAQPGMAQPDMGQPSAPKPNEGMNILKGLLGGFMEGAAWGMAPEMMKTKAALGAERDKSIQKFSMDMFMEDFKQNRMDNREQLKASLKSGEFEALRDPEIFISNLSNMVQAFDSVPLKGRGVSMLGAALAASPLGVGREERAKFDYWSEMLSYNIGGFVAGQTGRGLTENERELIKKAAVPKIGGGEGAFLGKIQGVLDSANSILAKEGKPTLPKASVFINSIRQGQNPIPEYTQQGGATQPGILDAIAAEKRRRGIQ